MKFRKHYSLIEAYLDKEEKFYDYGTENVSGNDIFDLHKTGFSYYNNFLNKQDAEYMKNTRNLVGGILYLTPTEYFEECASIFNSSVDNQINQIKADTEIINQLKEVITKYKRKFPLTYLNIAAKQQEGRHRMYVAGELFGWDTKFPVLVVQNMDDIRVKTEPLFEKKKDNELKKWAKWHKKHSKGWPWIGINKDAGNVPVGIDFFNSAMGAGDISGNVSTGDAGATAGAAMGEELEEDMNNNLYVIKYPSEIKDYFKCVEKVSKDLVNKLGDNYSFDFIFDEESFENNNVSTYEFYNDLVDELELKYDKEYGLSSTVLDHSKEDDFFNYKYTINVLDEDYNNGDNSMKINNIAKKHNVSVDKIKNQVVKGIKVEKEYTDDEKKAERIALDHLFEIPDYYDRLNKMEKGITEYVLNKGTKANESLNESRNDYQNFDSWSRKEKQEEMYDVKSAVLHEIKQGIGTMDEYYYGIGAELASRDLPFRPYYFLDDSISEEDKEYQDIKLGYLENGGKMEKGAMEENFDLNKNNIDSEITGSDSNNISFYEFVDYLDSIGNAYHSFEKVSGPKGLGYRYILDKNLTDEQKEYLSSFGNVATVGETQHRNAPEIKHSYVIILNEALTEDLAHDVRYKMHGWIDVDPDDKSDVNRAKRLLKNHGVSNINLDSNITYDFEGSFDDCVSLIKSLSGVKVETEDELLSYNTDGESYNGFSVVKIEDSTNEDLTESTADSAFTVYNSNDDYVDYRLINLDDSKEIGIHAGTEQAAREKGHSVISKIIIKKDPKIYEFDVDMTDIWSSPAIIRYIDFLTDEEKDAVKKEMRSVASDADKYQKYSKILRKVFLDKGFNLISYTNEVEDPGSTSYIIIDPSIIDSQERIEESLEENWDDYDDTKNYKYIEFNIQGDNYKIVKDDERDAFIVYSNNKETANFDLDDDDKAHMLFDYLRYYKNFSDKDIDEVSYFILDSQGFIDEQDWDKEDSEDSQITESASDSKLYEIFYKLYGSNESHSACVPANNVEDALHYFYSFVDDSNKTPIIVDVRESNQLDEMKKNTLKESSMRIDNFDISDKEKLVLEWDKHDGFVVSKLNNDASKDLWRIDFRRTYATEGDAKKAFRRYKMKYTKQVNEDINDNKTIILTKIDGDIYTVPEEEYELYKIYNVMNAGWTNWTENGFDTFEDVIEYHNKYYKSNTYKLKLVEDLIQSDSEEAFKKNVKTEIKAGKPKDQALAIAYSVKEKNMKESINILEALNKLDSKTNNKYDLLNTYLSENYTLEAKRSIVEAIFRKDSAKAIYNLLTNNNQRLFEDISEFEDIDEFEDSDESTTSELSKKELDELNNLRPWAENYLYADDWNENEGNSDVSFETYDMFTVLYNLFTRDIHDHTKRPKQLLKNKEGNLRSHRHFEYNPSDDMENSGSQVSVNTDGDIVLRAVKESDFDDVKAILDMLKIKYKIKPITTNKYFKSELSMEVPDDRPEFYLPSVGVRIEDVMPDWFMNKLKYRFYKHKNDKQNNSL